MDRTLTRGVITDTLPRILSAAAEVQAAVGHDDERFRVAVQRVRIRLQMLDYGLERALTSPEVLQARIDTFEDVPPQTYEEAIDEISRETGITAPPPDRVAKGFLRLAELLASPANRFGVPVLRESGPRDDAHHAEFPIPSQPSTAS